MLYLFAAKFIFGNSHMPDMVSKLSGTTKNLTTGLLQDPQKMENIIGMVRTVAPLTSPQTVSKVNTYLPIFEKASTLLGMYSFLSKAQTFRPIEAVDMKNPTDIMTAFMKNKNSPMGKMIAQPLIQNNMEKMMGTMAMNMIKNGGLNDILKSGNLNDMLKNGNLSDMLASFGQSQNSNGSKEKSSNIDLNSLMETFMPLLNSMSQSSTDYSDNSDNSDNSNDSYDSYKSNDSHMHNHDVHPNDNLNDTYNAHKTKDYFSDYRDHSKNISLLNETSLPHVPDDNEDDESSKYESYMDDYEKFNKQEKFKQEKHNKYDEYEYTNHEKPIKEREREIQRPIKIKQRRRR